MLEDFFATASVLAGSNGDVTVHVDTGLWLSY